VSSSIGVKGGLLDLGHVGGGGSKNNGKQKKKEGGGVTLIGKYDFRWKHIFQLRSCNTKCAE
jgi:hypothetical protein